MRALLALIFLGISVQAHAGRESHKFTAPEIAAIRAKCGTPKSELFMTESGAVHLQPRRDEKITKIDCTLNAMKSHYPVKAIGFVGNESYVKAQ